LGPDLTEQFLCMNLLSLGLDDPSLPVRVQCLLQLPLISKVVSQQFFKRKIVQFFYEMSISQHKEIKQAVC
jgi:hypothetical protein